MSKEENLYLTEIELKNLVAGYYVFIFAESFAGRSLIQTERNVNEKVKENLERFFSAVYEDIIYNNAIEKVKIYENIIFDSNKLINNPRDFVDYSMRYLKEREDETVACNEKVFFSILEKIERDKCEKISEKKKEGMYIEQEEREANSKNDNNYSKISISRCFDWLRR